MIEKNLTKKIKIVLAKYKWWIAGFIILLTIAYPFIFLLVNKITGINLGELYTFDLPLREFMTPWIAFWGVIGATLGVLQMQRRISIQEKQQETQQIQFNEQIEKQDVQIKIQQKQQEDQQKRWEKQDKQQEELRLEQQKQFETQIEKQNTQIQIQQKQLRDSRFSSGVELLGNINESARIGGAYNLYFLANEHQDEYLHPVCEILCAHIRTITSDKTYQKNNKEKPSNETQTILNLLFKKNKNDELIFDDCKKNLVGTFLDGADFIKAILSSVDFINTTLNSVDFTDAILNFVNFEDAKLHVNLLGAKLSSVNFSNATLNSVDFIYATFNTIWFESAKFNSVSFGGAKFLDFVDFSDAKFDGEIDFTGTVFEGDSFDEITECGIFFNEPQEENYDNQ